MFKIAYLLSGNASATVNSVMNFTSRQINNLTDPKCSPPSIQQYAVKWLNTESIPEQHAKWLEHFAQLNLRRRREYVVWADVVYELPKTKKTYFWSVRHRTWRVTVQKYVCY